MSRARPANCCSLYSAAGPEYLCGCELRIDLDWTRGDCGDKPELFWWLWLSLSPVWMKWVWWWVNEQIKLVWNWSDFSVYNENKNQNISFLHIYDFMLLIIRHSRELPALYLQLKLHTHTLRGYRHGNTASLDITLCCPQNWTWLLLLGDRVGVMCVCVWGVTQSDYCDHVMSCLFFHLVFKLCCLISCNHGNQSPSTLWACSDAHKETHTSWCTVFMRTQCFSPWGSGPSDGQVSWVSPEGFKGADRQVHSERSDLPRNMTQCWITQPSISLLGVVITWPHAKSDYNHLCVLRSEQRHLQVSRYKPQRCPRAILGPVVSQANESGVIQPTRPPVTPGDIWNRCFSPNMMTSDDNQESWAEPEHRAVKMKLTETMRWHVHQQPEAPQVR